MPIKLSYTHYIYYIPNSTSAQARGAEAKQKHKHGRCRGRQLCTSGSAAADDLGSGQQGGSSADPGVDMIELFLPRMYVLCVPLCKLHRCKTRPCTHVLVGIRLPGCILHDRALVHTRLPRCDLNDLSFAHIFMLSGVGSV